MLPQMVLIIPRIIPILFSNRGKQVLVMHVLPEKAFRNPCSGELLFKLKFQRILRSIQAIFLNMAWNIKTKYSVYHL